MRTCLRRHVSLEVSTNSAFFRMYSLQRWALFLGYSVQRPTLETLGYFLIVDKREPVVSWLGPSALSGPRPPASAWNPSFSSKPELLTVMTILGSFVSEIAGLMTSEINDAGSVSVVFSLLVLIRTDRLPMVTLLWAVRYLPSLVGVE